MRAPVAPPLGGVAYYSEGSAKARIAGRGLRSGESTGRRVCPRIVEGEGKRSSTGARICVRPLLHARLPLRGSGASVFGPRSSSWPSWCSLRLHSPWGVSCSLITRARNPTTTWPIRRSFPTPRSPTRLAYRLPTSLSIGMPFSRSTPTRSGGSSSRART